MKVIIKNNSLLSQKHGYDQRLFLPPTGYTLPTTTTHPKKKRIIKQEAKDREQRARNSFPPPLKEQLTFFKQNEKQKQAVQAAT